MEGCWFFRLRWPGLVYEAQIEPVGRIWGVMYPDVSQYLSKTCETNMHFLDSQKLFPKPPQRRSYAISWVSTSPFPQVTLEISTHNTPFFAEQIYVVPSHRFRPCKIQSLKPLHWVFRPVVSLLRRQLILLTNSMLRKPPFLHSQLTPTHEIKY